MLGLVGLLAHRILNYADCHTKMMHSLRRQKSDKSHHDLQLPVAVFVMFAGFTQILASIAFILFSRLIGQEELRDRLFFLCLLIFCEISYRLSLSLSEREPGRILGINAACIFIFVSFFFWNGFFKNTTIYSLICIVSLCFLVYFTSVSVLQKKRFRTPISLTISKIFFIAFLIIALGCFGLILAPKTVGGELWRFSNQPVTIIILFAPILLVFWFAEKLKASYKMLDWGLAMFIIILGVKVFYFSSEKDLSHWSFYFGPIWSTISGGKLLWDTPSQYGFLSILGVASLTKISGVSAQTIFGATNGILITTWILLHHYFLRKRLNSSALVAAVFSVATVLFFSGWVFEALGPAPFPSISAYRFLPAILAILLVEIIIDGNFQNNRTRQRLTFLAGVIVLSISCMWSVESCLYVAVSLGLYGGYRLLPQIFGPKEKEHEAVVSNPGTSQIPEIIKLILCSIFISFLFLFVYYFFGSNGFDIVGLFEVALGYAANLGVLPIERHPATLLFLFMLFLNFFIVRTELNHENRQSHTNLLWLGFCWIVASYFIARSHFNNVFNVLPLFLFCLCKYKTAIPSINMIQKVGIMTIGIFAVGIAVNATVINIESLSMRIKSRELLLLPEVDGVNPTLNEKFNDLMIAEPRPTAIVTREAHDWIGEFEGGGYALPLVPVDHFAQLPEARKDQYWRRLLERNPEYYLLCRPLLICTEIYRPNFVDFRELTFSDVSEKSDWQYFLVKLKEEN